MKSPIARLRMNNSCGRRLLIVLKPVTIKTLTFPIQPRIKVTMYRPKVNFNHKNCLSLLLGTSDDNLNRSTSDDVLFILFL